MVNVWLPRSVLLFFLLVIYCRQVVAISGDIQQCLQATNLKIVDVIHKGRCSILKAEYDFNEGISDAESTLKDALHYLNVALKEAEGRLDVDENCLEEKQERARTIHVKIIEKCRDYSQLDSLHNRLTEAKRHITSSFDKAVNKCKQEEYNAEYSKVCVKKAIANVNRKLRHVTDDVRLTTEKATGDVNQCAFSTARNHIRQIEAIWHTLQLCVNESTSSEQIIFDIETRLNQASRDVAEAVSQNTEILKNATVPIDKCIWQATASVENAKADLEELVTNILNDSELSSEDISNCIDNEKTAIAKVNSIMISDCAKCFQLQDIGRKISNLETLNTMIATATMSCRQLESETDKVEACIIEKIGVVENIIGMLSVDIKETVNLSVKEACNCAQDQSEYLIRKVQRIRENFVECVRNFVHQCTINKLV